MQVTCGVCGRFFEVVDQLAHARKAARCVCGARLELIKPVGGPQRLGKYLLLRRIAVGGMGEIFYGKIAGVEGFEREVAIKKMLPHLSADRNFIDMMIKEAKLTVLLNHPNIVQVYDLAREGNEHYIAMEYVPGTNVGHLLEQCHVMRLRPPVEVAVYVCMQVLKGLAYAHDMRGSDGAPMHILHRDITPQNILVMPSGWAKITDFGIAKARNEISTTSPGMIKGKLGYIAPEQIQGRVPDQRVDIFCAGICLWESLAAHRLFKGADEIDTFRLIAETRIPKLSTVRNDVPPAIEKALLGALAKSPDERYATADDFYNALNQAIFPSTVDDLARATKLWFAEHPEFFDNGQGADAPPADTPMTTLDLAAPKDADLVAVTELVAAPAAPRRRGVRPAPFLLAALLVSAAGGAAWMLHRSDATSSATAADARPQVTTPPRQLNELSAQEVELAVRAEATRLRECYCAAPSALRGVDALSAKLIIASTGGVASVEVAPSKLGEVGACLGETLSALRFRPHDRPVHEATVPLPEPQLASCPKATPRRGGEAASNAAASTPLSAEEIQHVVQRSSAGIVACLQRLQGKKAPAKVDARLSIATSGRVDLVEFTPRLEDVPASECLERSLKGLRFRRHPVKDFKVTIPLKIQVF